MNHPFLCVLQMSLQDVFMQQQKGKPMLRNRGQLCPFAQNWKFTTPMERR